MRRTPGAGGSGGGDEELGVADVGRRGSPMPVSVAGKPRPGGGSATHRGSPTHVRGSLARPPPPVRTVSDGASALPPSGPARAAPASIAGPPADAGTSPRDAAINLANCVMGAGALSLPAFFRSCGALLGLVLLLGSCAWTWCSSVMLLMAADRVSRAKRRGAPLASYEELMDLTLGPRGRALSSAAIFLLQIGCLVGYANILADVVSPFAIDILPPGLEPNRAGMLTAVVLGGMLPMGVLVGGDGASRVLAAVSRLSVAIVGCFASVLALHALAPARYAATAAAGSAGVTGTTTPTLVADGKGGSLAPVAWVNFGGAMSVLPLAVFAFGAHPAVLPVTRSMRPWGLGPAAAAVTLTMRVCFVGYVMIGLGGYLSFRDVTAGNVLRNLDGTFLGVAGSKALKFGYALVILASVPTILLPLQRSAKDAYVAFVESGLRSAPGGGSTPIGGGTSTSSFAAADAAHDINTKAANAFGGSGDVRAKQHRAPVGFRSEIEKISPSTAARLSHAVALGSMLAALGLSLYVPNVAFAFGLTGSTCSFLIAFVLPGLAFLSVTERGGGDAFPSPFTSPFSFGGGASPRKLAAKVSDGGVEMQQQQHPQRTNTLIGHAQRRDYPSNKKETPPAPRTDRDGGDPDEFGGGGATASAPPFLSSAEHRTRAAAEGVVDAEGGLLLGDEDAPLFAGNPGNPRGEKGVGVGGGSFFWVESRDSSAGSTRRWRRGAKAQILAATFLSFACTREVLRELMQERALVDVVSKIADAQMAKEKIERETTQIQEAKEAFEESSEKLEQTLLSASSEVAKAREESQSHNSGGGSRGTRHDEANPDAIDAITETLAEKLEEALHEKEEMRHALEDAKAETTTKPTRGDDEGKNDARALKKRPPRASPPPRSNPSPNPSTPADDRAGKAATGSATEATTVSSVFSPSPPVPSPPHVDVDHDPPGGGAPPRFGGGGGASSRPSRSSALDAVPFATTLDPEVDPDAAEAAAKAYAAVKKVEEASADAAEAKTALAEAVGMLDAEEKEEAAEEDKKDVFAAEEQDEKAAEEDEEDAAPEAVRSREAEGKDARDDARDGSVVASAPNASNASANASSPPPPSPPPAKGFGNETSAAEVVAAAEAKMSALSDAAAEAEEEEAKALEAAATGGVDEELAKTLAGLLPNITGAGL